MTLRNRLCIALLSLSPLCASAAGAPDAVLVPSAADGEKFQIAFDDKHIHVEAGSNDLYAQSKLGVRYYRNGQQGEPLAEIKYELNGLKVRDPSEKLLWKLKFEADKIKIADNEDMKNPYVIKLKPDEDKVFSPKNAELGAVKQSAESGKIKIKDAKGKELYTVETGRMSASYGVLLLKDIPAPQRALIAAEIFMQNR